MTAVTAVSVINVDMTATLAADKGANWDTDNDSTGWQLVDGTNGNKFTVTGHEVVLFRHADNSTLTITVESAPCDQGFTTSHNLTKTMTAGNVKEQFCALVLDKAHYGKTVDATANQVKITYSGTSAATAMRVIKLA